MAVSDKNFLNSKNSKESDKPNLTTVFQVEEKPLRSDKKKEKSVKKSRYSSLISK